MKKLAVWLMMLSLGAFTIGCGETADDAGTTDGGATTAPDTTTTPPAEDGATPPAEDGAEAPPAE